MANPASMPLRVALLNSQVGALPDNLAGLSFSTIDAAGSDTASFNVLLNQAIEQVSQNSCVELVFGQQVILMLPALTAAKQKCHPHAVLVGQGDSSANALSNALAQAKRHQDDVSVQIAIDSNELMAQLAEFSMLIASLHRRDLTSLNQQSDSYWFTRPHQARVASMTFGNAAWVLTQGTAIAPAASLLNNQRLLFILAANNYPELENQLNVLKSALNSSVQPSCLLTSMANNLLHYQAELAHRRYALVLQANNLDALMVEIQGMQAAVTEQKNQYKTPAGSYFSAQPLGQEALSFVYPGVGTVYPHMLKGLHLYFPEMYARLEREGDFAATLQADSIYPQADTKAPDMSLGELAIAGVGASYVLSKVLTQEFNVRPSYALGYSMGEAGMWASLDVWQAPHKLIEATQTSPIFTTAISGELTAVREAWQIGKDNPMTWNSFVVRSPADPIEALLEEFPRAYLPIIQGDTCVIAGCEQTCKDLLAKLGKRGIAANRVTAMHTPPAMGQHQAVLDFYDQPTLPATSQTPIKFMSAAHNQIVLNPVTGQIDNQVIAKSIADTFCNRLNFTQLIQSSREQGARLFVEVGADRQTSTLIDKINKADGQENQCCTVPMNAKGGDDAANVLKALAPMISHRVDVSLTPLIDGLQRQLNAQAKQAMVGGQHPTLLAEGEPL